MLDFERTIEINCVGENTKQVYKGTFVVKLFSSHNDRLKATREIKAKLGEIQSIVSGWNLNAFISSIDSVPSVAGEENIYMTEETKKYLKSLLLSYLPSVAPASSLLSNIIILNSHIVSAPDWWNESNNGFELYDETPVYELLTILNELVNGVVGEDE